MTTINRTPVVELIPVQRRPHLAKKIPIVASDTLNEASEQLIEKWRDTTPQGRELIRKKLWTLKQQLFGAKVEFDDHWAQIKSLFPKRMFTRALSVQDHDIRECLSGHLSRTQQWPAYQTSVERTAAAFELIKGWPDYKGHGGRVEFFQRIAGDHAHVPESVISSGSEKNIFAERSQFSSQVSSIAAAGL
jgi:hypothetical protein